MDKTSIRDLISSNKTMICLLLIIILLLLLSPSIEAQSTQVFRPKGLIVSFAALNNNYNGDALGKLTLTNESKKLLPQKGWKIYFNSKNMVKLEGGTQGFVLQKLKGNLFELSPTMTFAGLAPAKNISVNVLMEGAFINRNDQPEGFYIVWDDDLLKGYNLVTKIENKISLPEVNGKKQSDFAETIYKRNESAGTDFTNSPKIFPQPLEYRETNRIAIIDGQTLVSADQKFENESALLRNELSALFKTSTGKQNAAVKEILLKYKSGLPSEGYELNVEPAGITISASENAGVFYGIQSLKTLFPAIVWKQKQPFINVSCVTVKDQPRFSYRGMSLDVARDFQTKEEVLRMLDLMALYKLNTFHFHITDDEGWRVEIDGLPELTSFGATRGHSLDEKYHLPAAYGSGADTGKLYGSGFYTRKDFIEILQYAKARHINVVPEIETPGHARAAIKAMDARYIRFVQQGNREAALQYLLRDTLDQSVYSTPQWFGDNIMNVALPSVYTFVEKVVTEIKRMYTDANVSLTSIHMGGDEVAAGAWEKSPACNALIATDPTVRNTNDLWYYYLNKVYQILQAKGIALSGWEEIGLRKTELDGNKVMIPNPEFVGRNMNLYVWNNIGGNEDLAYKLANSGYKVVLAPVTNFYLDMTNYKTYDEPGYYWGSVTDIKKTYEFIPDDLTKNLREDDQGKPLSAASFAHKQRLTEYGKTNILGLQACMWSETLKGPDQLEYMLLPRLAAVAERAWAKDPSWANQKDSVSQAAFDAAWLGFIHNMGTVQLPLLTYYKGGYNYRIPPAGAVVREGAIYANTQFPGLTIRYALGGKEPTSASPVFENGMKTQNEVRLKVFNATGRSSYTTVVNCER